METGKTFVQVFIKSKEDWPKEKGKYFCCRGGFLSVQELGDDLPDKSFMREIRWYLKPVDLRPVGKEGIMNCIDAEPELPGEMPNEIYDSVQGDKNALTELLRITVRATEQGIKDRIATELSEVKPVQSNVTDDEINNEAERRGKEYAEGDPDTTDCFVSDFTEGAKWLRSRLQPAVAYNIGLQFSDNLVDLINCIKAYDKTAPLEEKGRYFEAIQRELEKIQPAVTDEQIEKWAESQHPSMTSPIICGYVLGLMDGAKAVLSDKIAEYIKNLK